MSTFAATAAAAPVPASEKKRKATDSDQSKAGTPNFPQMCPEGQAPRSSNGAGKVPKKESLAIQKLKQEVQNLLVKQKTNQRQMREIEEVTKFAKAWKSYKLFREADQNFDVASRAMEASKAYAEFMEKAELNNEGKPEDPIDVMRRAEKFEKEVEEQIKDAQQKVVDQRDKEAMEAAAKRAAKKEAKEAAEKEAKEAAEKEAKEAAEKEAAAKQELEAKKAEELALMQRLAELRAEMPPLQGVAELAVDVEPECSSQEDGSPAPKRTYTFPCKFCGAVTEGHMCRKKSCVTQRKAARKFSKEKDAATFGKGSSNPHSSSDDE